MINGKKIIALCTARIYDHQTQNFIENLNKSLEDNLCKMFIYTINTDLYWEENQYFPDTYVFDIIPFDKVDVLVIMDEKIKCKNVCKKIIKNAKEHDLPIIIIDGSYEGCISVRYDYEKGFENVVRHVIEEHKVKRPHFMAGLRNNEFSDKRIDVFKKVIREKGYVYDDSMVSYGEFWSIPARNAIKEVLKRSTIPDAVICANDLMAINVIDEIKLAGYKVPEDVIVSGFDGIDEAFTSNISLTTGYCDSSKLAEDVFIVILSCLKGDATGDYLVEPLLVTNESCGCKRNKSIDFLGLQKVNTSFYRYQDDIKLLHSISSKMLLKDNPVDVMQCMNIKLTQNMACVIYKEVFDEGTNFFTEDAKGKDFILVYDSYKDKAEISDFSLSTVLPDLERRMNTGFPIIFNSVDYMNKPFGFVCYSFDNCDITDYSKISNVTDMVSQGIGGYVNMAYQRFLMKKMREIYRIDSLTGLYNRTAFNEIYNDLVSNKDNINKTFTVLMSDMDKLKFINDTYGHDAGDKAIAAVASALKLSCPKDTIFVRYGGDEMIGVIPSYCDEKGIIDNINELLEKVSLRFGFSVSTSCGIYKEKLYGKSSFNDIVKLVDKKMYDIKKQKKRGRINDSH